MNYYLLLLFLMIFQLDAMDRKRDGQKICDDLLELVALIRSKKSKPNYPHVPEITITPTARAMLPVARHYHKTASDIIESYGITFKRLPHPPGARCRYECLTCKANVPNYKPHAISHTRERPCVCVCGQSYKQRGHLLVHEKNCLKAINHKKNRSDAQTIEISSSDFDEGVEESEYDGKE